MTITAIEPRKKHLSELFLDGESAALIDNDALAKAGWRVDAEMTQDGLDALIGQSNQLRAKNKALYLLGHRDHAQKELFQKLRRDFDEDTARQTVENLAALGLLDDAGYARKLAAELIDRRHFLPKRAVQELIFRGIDRELAQSICEQQEVDVKTQILTLLRGKYAGKLGDPKDLRRTVAALQRLGYGFGDIRSALEEAVDDT